jgi:hypothetical protein
MATARFPLCSDLPQDGKLRLCVERFQSSPSSDEATAQTIRKMVSLVRASVNDPHVMAYAKQAVWTFGGGASGGLRIGNQFVRFDARDPRVCAFGDFWWVKSHLKFVHHEKLLYSWLNEADQLQLLTKPADICKGLLPAEGDCAIYTMMIATLLSVQNVPWELVTVKCDPKRPDEYAHIFPRVILPSGKRVALDASHGAYPGWEVPQEHRFATQVWDSNGDPVPDEQWVGLHGYVRRGLGQDDGDTTTITSPFGLYPTDTPSISSSPYVSQSAIDALTLSPAQQSYLTQVAGGVSPSVAASSSGLTNAEVAALGNLSTSALNIVGRIVAPTTTITGPGGTSITTPSSSLSALAASGLTSLESSSSLLPILLIGGGLLVLVMMMGKH